MTIYYIFIIHFIIDERPDEEKCKESEIKEKIKSNNYTKKFQ